VARGKKTPKEVFVVVRRGWSEEYGDGWNFAPVRPEQKGRVLGRPVAVYADRAAAEARAEQLEQEARATLNPFVFLGACSEYELESVTSLPPAEFDARLKERFPKARLPRMTTYEHRDWFGWWSKLADGLTERQRAEVWGLLDRLRFYAVLPAEMG
jgi:hypothetical protein